MIKTTAITAAALLLSFAAYGQGGPLGGPQGGPPPGPPHRGFGPGGPGGPGFGMRPGKVVTGAPYWATFTNQFTQTLPGGNTIQRTTMGTIARDSQGRTYEQETVPGGPWGSQNTGSKTITFISDPVGGYSYTLDSTTNVAIQRPLRTPPARIGPTRNDPNVTVSTMTGGTYLNLTNIETRTTNHTIPAGTIGNAQPITSTSTVLYSPALQIVVSATRNDPRSGQSSYVLNTIVPGEPDASLFQVPSTYTIKAAQNGGHRPPRQ